MKPYTHSFHTVNRSLAEAASNSPGVLSGEAGGALPGKADVLLPAQRLVSEEEHTWTIRAVAGRSSRTGCVGTVEWPRGSRIVSRGRTALEKEGAQRRELVRRDRREVNAVHDRAERRREVLQPPP